MCLKYIYISLVLFFTKQLWVNGPVIWHKARAWLETENGNKADTYACPMGIWFSGGTYSAISSMWELWIFGISAFKNISLYNDCLSLWWALSFHSASVHAFSFAKKAKILFIAVKDRSGYWQEIKLKWVLASHLRGFNHKSIVGVTTSLQSNLYMLLEEHKSSIPI